MDDIMPTEILEDDEGSITHEDQEEFVYETHADVYSSPSKLLVPPDRDDSYESQESQEEDDNKHMSVFFFTFILNGILLIKLIYRNSLECTMILVAVIYLKGH